MDVSSLNIIPKSVIYKVLKWVNVVPGDALLKKNTSLLENVVYLAIAIGVAFLLIIMLFLMIYLFNKNPKIKTFMTSIKDKIIFGFFITTIIKSYLKLSISSVKDLNLGL